ncbi:MAG: cupin domain-containing protein [Deltaproteobacteria bacterium]|nr:cupin domain-containing protein [Deltaproteobacteria bacterium]
MKKIEIISEGSNYVAGNIGNFDRLNEYLFLHPQLKREVQAKLFVGKTMKSSSMEISFQMLPPNTEIPFYHKHADHEEIYIFLKGKGQFQIDHNTFDVQEGSIVKVAPTGKRTWRNSTNQPMIFMVIQGKAGSLEKYETADGFGVPEKVQW